MLLKKTQKLQVSHRFKKKSFQKERKVVSEDFHIINYFIRLYKLIFLILIPIINNINIIKKRKIAPNFNIMNITFKNSYNYTINILTNDPITKKINFSKYFGCFCVMGRKENLYAREIIEYYKSLEIQKFIIADNNHPGEEKFSDVLQDYINNGIVDLIPLFGSSLGLSEYYEIVYEYYRNICEWMTFFDFDEFFYMHNNDKKLNLREFLSNERYNKCEALIFNWLIYGDNDLVYYDNRPLLKRFTKPDFNNPANVIVKTIVKGNLSIPIFEPNKSNHVPIKDLYICDSKGKKVNRYNPFSIKPANFDYAYVIHFSTKTAEEYVEKTKRGKTRNITEKLEKRIHLFFRYNKFTEEKFKIFKEKFNKDLKREDYINLYLYKRQ